MHTSTNQLILEEEQLVHTNPCLYFPQVLQLLCAYSMDVDLTEQLKEAKEKYDQRVQEAAEAAAAATARREADVTPSQGEVRRWQRSGRYSRKVSSPFLRQLS